MYNLDRRTFLGASASALAVLRYPEPAMTQTACVSGNLPAFQPARLTVDCASRRNFQNFRKNAIYMGLTGVVSMTFVQGKWGG